ncbi:riboflavin kinase [Streptomyces sp. NPDC048425]|uniref:riboflavin kinase n=1 Tax=Streptomyces sp. NPDC048425 TaxID=3365548 RepID=UPI0037222866
MNSTHSEGGIIKRRHAPRQGFVTGDMSVDLSAHDPALVVTGVVQHGDARGRLLGFPTANIDMNPGPRRDGVWSAVLVTSDDGLSRPAAVSIGRRSTFYGREGRLVLEAHVLDAVGLDLYGREISVYLFHRIRPQRRFADVDDLVDRLAKDVDDVRAWAASVSLTVAR